MTMCIFGPPPHPQHPLLSPFCCYLLLSFPSLCPSEREVYLARPADSEVVQGRPDWSQQEGGGVAVRTSHTRLVRPEVAKTVHGQCTWLGQFCGREVVLLYKCHTLFLLPKSD